MVHVVVFKSLSLRSVVLMVKDDPEGVRNLARLRLQKPAEFMKELSLIPISIRFSPDGMVPSSDESMFRRGLRD
jgi:hypothetical protein